MGALRRQQARIKELEEELEELKRELSEKAADGLPAPNADRPGARGI